MNKVNLLMPFVNNGIVAVIPAAGKPTNKILVNSSLPDAMLPINGKPVIGYILEDLMSRGINRVIVILHGDDTITESYLKKKFSTKCTLSVIYNDDYSRGVGYSVCLAAPYVDGAGVFIYLGDTIYKGPLTFENNFLVTSREYDSSDKWCFVEKNTDSFKLINKPVNYEGNGCLLCGLYFLKSGENFKKATAAVESENNTIEMSDLLSAYRVAGEDFDLIQAEKWYDCGNVENYYQAKMDFLKIRNFNSISYNDLYGFVTKTGKNRNKILSELNWYQNIPNELRIFMPRLVDYQVDQSAASYSLEYYGYQSLADNFVFGSLNTKLWRIIIDRLFEILRLFRKHEVKLPQSFYYDIYYKKTIERISDLRSDPIWNKILDADKIIINGQIYNNFSYYSDRLSDAVRTLYEDGFGCFMHGDLCLSNILFDYTNKIFKFIDPRGVFGEMSVYGDQKYDVAKLRHSFCGLYDFIVSDLFDLRENTNHDYTLTCFHDRLHDEIGEYFDSKLAGNGFDVEKIKLIESLLFLSMVPLHSDNVARQKAMYLTGLQLLNKSKLTK